jgi:DNA-binding NarL/FixJ family response regulator
MRILLADDHGIVRRGMRALLDSEEGLEVVGEAANGREALKGIDALRPDLAILDVAMPMLNGIEVTAQAMKSFPELKVIILSMYADEAYVVRA